MKVGDVKTLLQQYRKKRGILYYLTPDHADIRKIRKWYHQLKSNERILDRSLTTSEIYLLTKILFHKRVTSPQSAIYFFSSLEINLNANNIELLQILFKYGFLSEKIFSKIYHTPEYIQNLFNIFKLLFKEKLPFRADLLCVDISKLAKFQIIIKRFSQLGLLTSSNLDNLYTNVNHANEIVEIFSADIEIERLIKQSNLLPWIFFKPEFSREIVLTMQMLSDADIFEKYKDILARNLNHINIIYFLIENLVKLNMFTHSNAEILLTQATRILQDKNYAKSFIQICKLLHSFVRQSNPHKLLETKNFLQVILLKPELHNEIIDILENTQTQCGDDELYIHMLMNNTEHFSSINKAMQTLKQNRVLHDGFKSVLAQPVYAENIAEIFVTLQNMQYMVGSEFCGALREIFLKQVKYWQDIRNLISIIFNEKLFPYIDLIYLINHFSASIKIMVIFLEIAQREKILDINVMKIICVAGNKKNELLVAIQDLTKIEDFPKDAYEIIFHHRNEAIIYTQALLALHQMGLYNRKNQYNISNKDLLNKRNGFVAQLIVTLRKAKLLNQKNLELLLMLSDTPVDVNLEMPESVEVRQEFINDLQKINHPYAYFVLGKIFSGEMWGFNECFDADIAAHYLKKASEYSQWNIAAKAILYNINLNHSEANHPKKVYKNYKFFMELAHSKHPLAVRWNEAYGNFQQSFKLKWSISQAEFFETNLFNLFSNFQNNLYKRLQEDMLFQKKDEPEGRRAFDKRFALVK